VSATPGLLPWAAGFAAGALLFLVLTELLPGSYERAHRAAVALLVSTAAGLTILAHALLMGASR
jgi:zinc transporter ZupT